MGIYPASRCGAAAGHHTDGSHLTCLLTKPKSRYGHSLLRQLHWTGRDGEIPARHRCGTLPRKIDEGRPQPAGCEGRRRVCEQPMTKAKAIVVPVTPFQQNCTVLWC